MGNPFRHTTMDVLQMPNVTHRLPPAKFKLHQPFAPSGDQPEAIRALVQGFQAEEPYQVLLGATGTGKTYTMANVISQLGRPALVLSHNKTLAAQLYSEFREFFPQNAVHYFVSYYDYYQPEAYIQLATSISKRIHRSTKRSIACGWPRPVPWSVAAMS